MAMTKASLDYEVGVIGSLLVDPETIIGDLMYMMTPEDFSVAAYRHIFEAARGLWLEHKTVDALTVAEAAGDAYKQTIMDCMAVTPTAANWKVYAQGAKDATLGHRLDDLADQIKAAESTAEKLRLMTQMQELRTVRSDVKEVKWIDGLRAAYTRHSEHKRPNYLTWGIDALDRNLYIRPGSFVILGGFASAGKTALGTQFALHFARHGHRVGIYSLETDDQTLFDRMLAQASGANFGHIKNETLTQADFDAMISTGLSTKDYCLTYVGASGWDVSQIQAHATARGYDVILIDYVQLIRSSGANRAEEVAKVSMQLHTFAQRTSTTIVGLSQLTPTGSATPGMNDLRESRQLTQDADAILMLFWDPDECQKKTDRILHAVKNKEGEPFRTRLVLDPSVMRLEPPPEPDYDENDDDDKPRRRRHQGARSRKKGF